MLEVACMSATGRMWQRNWRLDFPVVRFAIQAVQFWIATRSIASLRQTCRSLWDW